MASDMKSSLFTLLLVILLPAAAMSSSAGQGNQMSKPSQTRQKQSSSVPAADAAEREGNAALRHGDLAAARRSFERSIRMAPTAAGAHAALGPVLLALGEYPASVHELETAHRLDHSDKTTLLNLCQAYTRNQEYNKAIGAYREFKSGADPSIAISTDTAIAVATAFASTGDNAAAQEVVQRSLASGTDDARLEDTLGTLVAQQQDYSSAEVHLRRAIALDPSLASAHYHLGSVESATNRAPDALAELGQAHSLDLSNAQYSLDLARALLLNGQDGPAIEVLRASLARLSRHSGNQAIDVKYRLALALQSAGNVREAMPLFTAVVAARPDDAEALTNAALAHVQLGDAKAGITLYLRAVKLTPANPTVREDLGVAYLQQADLDHALEQFRAGLLIDDRSPQLHYDFALALKLKDNLDAAVPEFERAAELDPQLPDPPFTLGILYMQQGKFEKSAASFETAVALRPDNGEAWATLGSVYQQMQQPDKAVPALRKAIELMPRQPSPHITLAAILAGQGKRDEAAAERKTGAELSRAATNRQKANFGLDSGTLLMKRGKTADALVQFQDAVEADPNYAAPHLALADALDHSGRKAEAAEERRKAAAIKSVTPSSPE